ncbi:MAG: glycosyltransferase family 4 protein [Verrucomicrobiota bacterium]
MVCQLGAREHYLVARCFAKSGSLAALVTDFWSPRRPIPGWIRRWLPKVVLSALARYHSDLADERVESAPVLSLLRHGLGMLDKSGRWDGVISWCFARRVRNLRIPHDVFFGYSYDSLEILRDEKGQGVFSLVCQTDPGPAHYRMVGEEEDRWPDYVEVKSLRWTPARAERLREEWALADVIVVNSEWTREMIVAEGADPAKIELLPLAYVAEDAVAEDVVSDPLSVVRGACAPRFSTSAQLLTTDNAAEDVVRGPLSVVRGACAPSFSTSLQSPTTDNTAEEVVGRPLSVVSGACAPSFSTSSQSQTTDNRQQTTLHPHPPLPLRVLWIGNVALGKGIQYLVEAARLLADEPVEFLVGGSHYISAAAVSAAPKSIRWLGQIPRSQTAELYRSCDVFVFPTLSDGFGITQLEAMARGLPVITTPNCGRVVEEGKTGFIVPARDPQALAGAILRFIRDPELAARMAPDCPETVREFSVDAYSRRLLAIIDRHKSAEGGE